MFSIQCGTKLLRTSLPVKLLNCLIKTSLTMSKSAVTIFGIAPSKYLQIDALFISHLVPAVLKSLVERQMLVEIFHPKCFPVLFVPVRPCSPCWQRIQWGWCEDRNEGWSLSTALPLTRSIHGVCETKNCWCWNAFAANRFASCLDSLLCLCYLLIHRG